MRMLGSLSRTSESVMDLYQGVGGVRNQFSKEDILVGVEGVNDEGHQLLDISVESKYFFRHWLSVFSKI